MKPRLPLLAACLCLLTACGLDPSGPGYVYPNDRYLDENVAAWNSMVVEMNVWNGTPVADEFHTALSHGEDLSRFQFRLGNAHAHAVERRANAERWTHRAEADRLHQDLLTSLQSTADMFAIMVALAELPQGYTAEEAAILVDRLEQATGKMHDDATTLSLAQDAFAEVHGITLVTHDGTGH